jgi:myo-inositol-1(or 4)-monophosphatase
MCKKIIKNDNYIINAALQSGKFLLDGFQSKYFFSNSNLNEMDNIPTFKSSSELVLEEDIKSQNIIIESINKFDPDSKIYSEELSNLNTLNVDTSNRKYLIDPLDGTHNYYYGLPFWGVSIAVLDSYNNSVFGVIYLPFYDLLIYGDGDQTFTKHKGISIKSSSTRNTLISKSLICYDSNPFRISEYAEKLYRLVSRFSFCIRTTGSAVFDTALIATGSSSARIWNNTNSYDIAASIPIVNGIGGKITDHTGKKCSIFTSSVVASSSSSIHTELLDLFKQIVP